MVLGAQNTLTPLRKISSGSALGISGWCRVAEIMPSSNGIYGSFLIQITARHMHSVPSPVVLLLSFNSGKHSFQQLGKRPSTSGTTDIQKVRVVQSGSAMNTKIYLDIYYHVSSSGGNTVNTYIMPLEGVDYNLTEHSYEDVNEASIGNNYTEITPEVAA